MDKVLAHNQAIDNHHRAPIIWLCIHKYRRHLVRGMEAMPRTTCAAVIIARMLWTAAVPLLALGDGRRILKCRRDLPIFFRVV